MSLLRVLRNLGVLVILTVGGASLVPRPMAAQSTCEPLGSYCKISGFGRECCTLVCGPYHNCCNTAWGLHAACTTNADCCSLTCRGGRCY
jgi:hypothetical protein